MGSEAHSFAPGTPLLHHSPTCSLAPRVLPAATATELLQRLAEAISAEALFVRRIAWPQFLCVRRTSDACLSMIVDAKDVPTNGRALGHAVVIGGETFDEAEFTILAEQARVLDDHSLNEKLAAMAELAAGAGHEVNNPLGSIVGRATLLRSGETDPERLKTLAAIVAQAYRGRDMIGDLMLFARPPALQPECVPVDEAIREVIEEFEADLTTQHLTITGDRDPSVAVWADATQFRIVCSELLRNSSRFAPEHSAITWTALRLDDDLLMTVVDDGPTLSAVERRHLFDPFFSGRQAGRGLGFGLSKCWRIVTLHGGRISHDDATGRNRFSVRWPCHASD